MFAQMLSNAKHPAGRMRLYHFEGMYTEILKREMGTTCRRKDYRHIIRHLDALRSYPKEESAARNLATYWHTYHKKRPAMKDELRKAGYLQK